MPLVRPPRYPLYVFDLDGTVYRGSELIRGAAQVIEKLRESGSQVRFLTNNSSLTRVGIAGKLSRLGVEATPEECYGTAHAAALLALERRWRRVFVVGEAGLKESLGDAGVEIQTSVSQDPNAVIVGICRQLTYEWLNQALQGLRQGAEFVATNRDATYPLENDAVAPGAGAIVSALETAWGRAPLVLGKPEPELINLILRDAGVAASDALVIGDRLDTDIAAAKRAGCPSWLVLSGVTQNAPEDQSHGLSLADLI